MSVTDARSPNDARFRTTRWSLVRAAGDLEHDDSREALGELCQAYWFPVYAYFRRRTNAAIDAQDLTQDFFTTLLEKNYLGDARRDRGRFRTFLLTAAQRFLSKEWAKSNALKRGGGAQILSLDFSNGETLYANEPVDNETPEQTFDRRWALSLLEIVQHKLYNEYVASGKKNVFDRLQPYLISSETTASYDHVAHQLGQTVGAVKTAVYRMRRRYRELLRAEIAETVSDQAEVDDEIHELFAALG
jgi:DNA-directed RNA polymerase specialized sigma24 family protein